MCTHHSSCQIVHEQILHIKLLKLLLGDWLKKIKYVFCSRNNIALHSIRFQFEVILTVFVGLREYMYNPIT